MKFVTREFQAMRNTRVRKRTVDLADSCHCTAPRRGFVRHSRTKFKACQCPLQQGL